MRSVHGRRSSPPSDAAWLAARSRGECPPGAVFLHAPATPGVPGREAGGENQLVQTGRHLEGHGIRVRLFSPWTDRLESARLLHLFGMSREGLELARPGASVARGARGRIADLLVSAPGARRSRAGPGPQGRGPVGLGPALHRARPSLVAAGFASSGGRRAAPTRRPRPISWPASSGSRCRPPSASCQMVSSPPSARHRPTRSASGEGPDPFVLTVGRSRAPEEYHGPHPARSAGSACR